MGTYEAYETELFCQSIKPHMTIVDVGANFGYYSLVGAKSLNGTGQVIAFEPVPSNYQLLVKNIQQNQFKNIIPVQKALSDMNGARELFLNARNYGNCSFSDKNVSESASPITVETLTLDSYLKKLGVQRVDLLKIDVEGAEPLVLKGARQTLQQTRLIFMEFWPSAIRNLHQDPAMVLKELNRNFTVSRIDEPERRLIEVSDQELADLVVSNGHLNIFLEAK
jgi:FkbM family methyltransferase